MSAKSCGEIVKEYLIANKIEGVCCDGCGCSAEDYPACGEYNCDCVTAKLIKCTDGCSECEYDTDYCNKEIYIEHDYSTAAPSANDKE